MKIQTKTLLATLTASAALAFAGNLQAAPLTSVDFSGLPTQIVSGGNQGHSLAASETVYALESSGVTTQPIDTWVFDSGNEITYDSGAETYFSGTEGFVNRRGTLQIMNDGKATTGQVTVGLDFTITTGDDISLELYAWNSGQASPSLSWGGPGTGTSWNDTVTGDAVTLLDETYASGTSASEVIDLGVGYDFYFWRVGLSGANGQASTGLVDSGTTFSNLTVVPEPGSLALLGLGGLLMARRRRNA